MRTLNGRNRTGVLLHFPQITFIKRLTYNFKMIFYKYLQAFIVNTYCHHSVFTYFNFLWNKIEIKKYLHSA